LPPGARCHSSGETPILFDVVCQEPVQQRLLHGNLFRRATEGVDETVYPGLPEVALRDVGPLDRRPDIDQRGEFSERGVIVIGGDGFVRRDLEGGAGLIGTIDVGLEAEVAGARDVVRDVVSVGVLNPALRVKSARTAVVEVQVIPGPRERPSGFVGFVTNPAPAFLLAASALPCAATRAPPGCPLRCGPAFRYSCESRRSLPFSPVHDFSFRFAVLREAVSLDR